MIQSSDQASDKSDKSLRSIKNVCVEKLVEGNAQNLKRLGGFKCFFSDVRHELRIEKKYCAITTKTNTITYIFFQSSTLGKKDYES